MFYIQESKHFGSESCGYSQVRVAAVRVGFISVFQDLSVAGITLVPGHGHRGGCGDEGAGRSSRRGVGDGGVCAVRLGGRLVLILVTAELVREGVVLVLVVI